MFEKIITIFKGDVSLKAASKDFTRMMELAEEMIIEASAAYWDKPLNPEQRTALYDRDIEVNKLERRIRKHVVAHLSTAAAKDIPYGLLMMSLVKDVERLGDYAKNLVEVHSMAKAQLPDDEVVGELREIRRSIERLARESAKIWVSSDRERARQLTKEGRSMSKRCDEVIPRIAGADYPAAVAVNLTLCTRFYKRICGHFLNLLSSVLMPLHKLDYYDEHSLQE